ncbi:MAG: hypothetical protein HQK78_19835 [Desulfobacterales bacterium]|nr:hypothetical protein [Desulfobacterales bacterium]
MESEKIIEKQIKQQVLTLSLDEPTINWLKEVANKKGLSASALARMWLLERLSNEEKQKPSFGEWV